MNKHGLRLDNLIDRQLMVVDADTGNFLTARKFPKLVLVDVDIDEDHFVTLSGPEVNSVQFKLPRATGRTKRIQTHVRSTKASNPIKEWPTVRGLEIIRTYLKLSLDFKSQFELADSRTELIRSYNSSILPMLVHHERFSALDCLF